MVSTKRHKVRNLCFENSVALFITGNWEKPEWRKKVLKIGENKMATIGMIRLACFCGADLFYVGTEVNNKDFTALVEQIKKQLKPGDYGFFSRADGQYGECPYCGLSYELPDPELMDWLPFVDKDRFDSSVDDIRKSSNANTNTQRRQVSIRRYLL